MKKQTFLGVLLLLVMFCFNAKADVITVEGASEIANAFFSQSARSQKTQLKSTTQLEYAWDSNSLTQSGSSMLKSVEEDPTFYVFNNPDGEGFVIVSGDSNTRSIIGYSYEGNAPAVTDIPLPMQDYLSGIDAEVKYARENITSTGNNLKNYNENIAGTPIVEIETAKWGQSTPFNNLCPVVQVYDSNNNIIETSTLTGCVPTAFSIVMRYHEWPIQGKGSIVASWTVDQYNGYNATNYPVVTIDHTATTYDWDNMPLEYSANWTQENITQVATLMRNVGYAFGVTYTPGNTYVSDGNLPDRIKTCFDYTIETVAVGNYNVSGAINDISEWKDILKSSLDNDCPIPYAANNSGTGDSRHMFVVDGYTNEDYFHFNFGWNGNGNGWFTIDAITPSTGDNYSWTATGSEHRAYINFKPNKQVTVSVAADPATEGSVTIDGESVTSKTVDYGTSVTLQAAGSNFYGWLVNGEVVSTEITYIFTANKNTTYTAKFATPTTLNLLAALTTDDGGYELDNVNKPTASAYSIVEGVSIELNANTERGYSFLGWYDADENLIDSKTPTTINITSQIYANPYIFAKYTQLTPISVTSFVSSADENTGTVSCKLNGGAVSEVYSGEEVTLVASPIDASYVFKNWTLNGTEIQGGATITVTVSAGQTYVATFVATSELADITVNMNKGGTVSINGGTASSQAKVTDVSVGSYITIEAHPISPNEFLYWVDYYNETNILSESNPWNFQVTGTARYKAIMGEPLTVSVTSEETKGTATAYPTKVLSGKTTTLTATPAQGYEFVNWTLNGVEVSTQNPYIATITESANYVANFRQTEQGGGEEIEVAQLDRTNWSVTASSQEPAEAQWNGGGEARHTIDGSESTFWHTQWDAADPTIPHWIQFNLGGLYEISAINYVSRSSVTNQNNGQISEYRLYISTNDISANINSSTYVPNGLNPVKDDEFTYGTTNHHNVTLDAPVVGQYIYLLVDNSHNVDANGVKYANCAEFYASGKPAYAVSTTASPAEGGTASVSAPAVGAGETATFTATANTGYNFIGWYNGENKVSDNAEYTATVTSNLSLTAKFAKQTFTVSATPGGTNGTATVSPSGTVEYGTQVTFTASPASGYRFTAWTKGTETVSDQNPYTVTITQNTELVANFEAIPTFTVNVTTNGTGGTATASQGTVQENGTVTLTASAASGYRFTGWYQGGEFVSTANPYTISSVTSNINYVANFVESSDELLLTFACLSDLHAQQDLITDANNIQLRESVTKTLEQIKSQENVDLIVLGGDYTSNNTIPQTSWEKTRELLVNATRGAFNGAKTPVIYVNGNHEFEVANYDALPKNYNAGEYYGTPMKTDIGALAPEDCFYETATNGTGVSTELLAAYHYVVNGFDFVVLNTGKNFFASASDYTYSIESVQWCASKLSEIYATDPNKTVFFLVHIPFSDSNSLSSTNKGMNRGNDAEFVTLLKSTLAQYPNLVMLYGHDHGGDSAYIRTATSQRVTEYATDGSKYTGAGSSQENATYYIQNYNTSKYLGYNSYNLSVVDTQSSDVTITPSTVTDGAFVFDFETTLTNQNSEIIRYLHCGSNGRFSGNGVNTATNQQIQLFKVENPSATTITATKVTEVTGGATYMLVATNDGTNYYALTDEMYSNNSSSQRMTGAAVTITNGTITYSPGTASVLWKIVNKPSANDKSFFSSFMGSMRYYENTIEGTDQLDDRKIIQALMVYVYADRVELKMKNYGESGTINGVTVNQDLTPYISYRTVTHSAEAVTAAPVITSTGGEASVGDITVTIDAPEWHNLYYTINGETPTEASQKVVDGQITFTAVEGEYIVKVVAQEGVRLVSPVASVTYNVVDTHGITVSATEGGTAQFTIENGNVILTASEPAEGYYFVGWSVGESAEIVSDDLTYTTTIVENAAYKANYAKLTFTVTVRTNNAEWGTVNTIANPVAYGETVELVATPAEGYRFVNWTKGTDVVSTNATFTTPAITANVEYVANFELIPDVQYFDVVAIAGDGGSATVSSNSVEENTTVTLTATPDEGYLFVNWTVAGVEVSTENPYTPTITATTKFVAHFKPQNAESLPTGYCTISQRMNESCSTNSLTNVHTHALQGLTATYNGSEVLTLPAASSTFNDMTASKQITVVQGEILELTFTPGAWTNNVWFGFDWDRNGDWDEVITSYEGNKTGGDTNPKTISVEIPYNALIGKSVMRIVSDGVDCSSSWNVQTPMCGTHGTGIIGYAGSYHDITLYVEEGYVSDVTYNVTVSSADENMGTASASSSIVIENRSVTLTAEPKEGYGFVNWTNEGEEVSTANPYTIKSVTGDIDYVAHFEKLPVYTVTASSNNRAMGTVTPLSSSVTSGKTITLTATPTEGCRFVNWTKGTDVVSTNATFTTPAITENVEYVANFGVGKIAIVEASTNFATYDSNVISNIKDGNYSSLFWSEGEQVVGKYIMVDLGALYNVEDIKFYFDSGDKPYGAVVEISTDNSTWTEVSTFVTTDLGADNTYVCDAEKKTAQYIRMRINVAGRNWLKLKELEVYGLKAGSSVEITKTTATASTTVKVTTDAPATITVGTKTYTTTEDNLTVEIPISATDPENVEISATGANITAIDCGENAVPTELPTTITEVELRNTSASEVELTAPALEKITVVSDADDKVATVSPASDLSQGVQVVVEKEIYTPKTLADGTTPTIFNFLSMPFAFNTANIKYWNVDSWESVLPETHVRILLYNYTERAEGNYKNTWRTLQATDMVTVAANQGFVIVGNSDLGSTVKLQFTSEVAAYDGSVTSVTANRYRKEEGETNLQDQDWNFNGVPYLTAGEFAGDYTLYTYNNNTLSYVSHTPTMGLTLKPYQAVMYQAEIEGASLTKDIAINTASVSAIANGADDVYARAYISIDDATPAKIILCDETSENFVVNEDAWYMPSLVNTTPATYFNIEGAEASVSVQPSANELPMTVYTGAGTSHRISLAATDGNYNVYLKDAATDEVVCLNDEDYNFTATAKTTIAGRFTVSMLEPTGIIDAARAEGTIKPVVLSNAIKLYGTEEGDQVSLYTANGMIITNAVAEEGVTTIPTSVTGVIIIKVAGETIKVVK